MSSGGQKENLTQLKYHKLRIFNFPFTMFCHVSLHSFHVEHNLRILKYLTRHDHHNIIILDMNGLDSFKKTRNDNNNNKKGKSNDLVKSRAIMAHESTISAHNSRSCCLPVASYDLKQVKAVPIKPVCTVGSMSFLHPSPPLLQVASTT